MSEAAVQLHVTRSQETALQLLPGTRAAARPRGRAFWIGAALGLVGLGTALNAALLLLSAGWPTF